MAYSEASFFDGYAFQHIAAWEDHLLQTRRNAEMVRYRRRALPLVSLPIDAGDAERFPNIAAAVEHARKLRGDVR